MPYVAGGGDELGGVWLPWASEKPLEAPPKKPFGHQTSRGFFEASQKPLKSLEDHDKGTSWGFSVWGPP